VCAHSLRTKINFDRENKIEFPFSISSIAFYGFGEVKFPYGGMILYSSQIYTTLMMLDLTVVKIDIDIDIDIDNDIASFI